MSVVLAALALISGGEREVIRPAKVAHEVRQFTPPAQASPSEVKRIIWLEAAKWGANGQRLTNRVSCETGGRFHWYANNGQYDGVGQFANETFSRGFHSIGTRRVIEHTVRTRYKRTRIIIRHPDGTREITYGMKNKQEVRTTWKGWIPKWEKVPKTHTYAQLRIMSRSMVGLGNVRDSEWSCR